MKDAHGRDSEIERAADELEKEMTEKHEEIRRKQERMAQGNHRSVSKTLTEGEDEAKEKALFKECPRCHGSTMTHWIISGSPRRHCTVCLSCSWASGFPMDEEGNDG